MMDSVSEENDESSISFLWDSRSLKLDPESGVQLGAYKGLKIYEFVVLFAYE